MQTCHIPCNKTLSYCAKLASFMWSLCYCFTGTWSFTNTISSPKNDLDSEENLIEDSLEDKLEAMSAASRDRTNEFQAVIKSIKSRQVSCCCKSKPDKIGSS